MANLAIIQPPEHVRDRQLHEATPRQALQATLFLAFAFTLPPQIGTAAYATLLTLAAAIFTIPVLRHYPWRVLTWDYLLAVSVFAFYLPLSYKHILAPPDRLYSQAEIIPQAAGMMILLLTIPAFVEAMRVLMVWRRWGGALFFIGGVTLASIVLLRTGENIFLNGRLYGTLAPALMLQFLYFIFVLNLTSKPIWRTLLLLTAVPFLGASSNNGIQLGLAILALTRMHRTVVISMLIAALGFIFLMAFRPPFIEQAAAKDGNTWFRMIIWSNALSAIFQHPWGIGFGISSSTFAQMHNPGLWSVYGANIQRSLQIPNHNSILDTTLRLGVPGALALGIFTVRSCREMFRSPYAKIASAACIMTIVTCSLNPGIESARSAIFVAFAYGTMRAATALAPRRRTSAAAEGKLDTSKNRLFPT